MPLNATFVKFFGGVEQIGTVVLVAVLVLLIGLIIGHILGRLVQRFLAELEVNKILAKMGVKFAFEETAGAVVKGVVYLAAIIVALSRLGVASFVLNLLLAAIIVSVIIAFLLGIRDFIPNFIAGISLHRSGVLKKGKRVRVQNIEGRVVEVALLETRLKTKKGDTIVVPNVLLKKSVLTIKK